MKKHFKSFTSSFALLTSFMLSPTAEAQLTPEMLKGITEYFRADMTHYSPVIGMAALESGLAHDLRLYGNLDAGQKKDPNGELTEERLYSADKAHVFGQQKDAVFTLLHTLFRSPAGTLAPHTAGEGMANFHSVVTPAKVAVLLNYVQELTQLKQPFQTQATGEKAKNLKVDHEHRLIKKLADLKAKHKKLLLTKEEAKNNKNGLKKDIDLVMNAVEASVSQEMETDSEKKFLYPEHTTEQLILAYSCQQFNDQKDVLELVAHLNNQIVEPTKHIEVQERLDRLNKGGQTPKSLLTKEDLEDIAKKTSYNIDDIYALTHAYLFEVQVTPYGNQNLIDNSACKVYDRKNNQQLTTSSTDCGETAARHFINLIAYDAQTKAFDFTSLLTHVKDNANPYFDNFIEFYKHQTPDQVNNGDIDMRSKWNHVVGDLNNPTDPIQIRYMKKQGDVEYELDTGIINLLHAYDKIFSLSLEPLQNTANFENKKNWIETSLTKLFKTIKPDYKCTFNLSKLKDDPSNHDVGGTVPFTVQDQNRKDLFSFEFYAAPKVHSNIRSVKATQDPEAQTIQYKQSLQLKVGATNLKGVFEDIWLATKDKNLIQFYVHEPLYKLLDHKLDDNESKIAFFENMLLVNQTFTKRSFLQKDHIKQITRNILKTLSWEDNYVFNKVSPIIEKLLKLPQFQEIFAYDEIQRVLSREKLDNFKRNYKNYKNLKQITLVNDTFEEFVLSPQEFNWFKTIKNISLKSSELKKFTVTEAVPNLLKLNLNNNISLKTIENIEYLMNLDAIELPDSHSLEELVFRNQMNQLGFLNLNDSGIKKLEGLENLSALKFLLLVKTRNLEELKFTSKMNQLKTLNLNDSGIKKLEGLENLSVLDRLSLSNTKNLQELVFTKQMDQLETLFLSHSSIKVIKGSNYLNDLTTFIVSNTQLSDDSLRDLNMKKMKNLELVGCKNITSLNFEEENKILKLNLAQSGITQRSQINGIEYLDESKIIW